MTLFKKKLNLDKIQGFKNKIINFNPDALNDYFNNIPCEDIEIMEDIILYYNYPRVLKKSALKLYKYLEPSNLVFCASNLLDITLIKKTLYGVDSQGYTFRISAAYLSKENSIIYKKNKDIYHEFIHMSSRSPLKCKNGFHAYDNGIYTTGLNEGYTELLSRRIFFDNDYNTSSYKFYVDFMLLFENLYDNYKDMESDYFKGNYDSLKDAFLKYGTEEEYYHIIATLSKEYWLLTEDEKDKLLCLMKDIISRKNYQKKQEKKCIH